MAEPTRSIWIQQLRWPQRAPLTCEERAQTTCGILHCAQSRWDLTVALFEGCHGREMPTTWSTGLTWELTWTTSPPTPHHCCPHRKSWTTPHLTLHSVCWDDALSDFLLFYTTIVHRGNYVFLSWFFFFPGKIGEENSVTTFIYFILHLCM